MSEYSIEEIHAEIAKLRNEVNQIFASCKSSYDIKRITYRINGLNKQIHSLKEKMSISSNLLTVSQNLKKMEEISNETPFEKLMISSIETINKSIGVIFERLDCLT